MAKVHAIQLEDIERGRAWLDDLHDYIRLALDIDSETEDSIANELARLERTAALAAANAVAAWLTAKGVREALDPVVPRDDGTN